MLSQPVVHSLLFEGLAAADLEKIQEQMRPRHFQAGEFICREGEQGNSLFVIASGAAQVVVGPLTDEHSKRASRSLARLRRGDVVGEMSLLTGDPRSATVIASIDTTVLELTQDTFAALLAHYPTIITNLSRILSRRLAFANTRLHAAQGRHEAVALLVAQQGLALVPQIIAATKSASPHRVEVLSLTELSNREPGKQEMITEGMLGVLDDLLLAHRLVIVVASSDSQELALLLKQVDRAVAVVSESEAARLIENLQEARDFVDLVLLTEDSGGAPPFREQRRVIHSCNLKRPERDIAWVGRHLSRTKIGLALGAGGAKGYAHIGVLHVLEEAGYTVDYVSGSSIGAMVGCWLAMGENAAEIEATMRDAFTPETVAATFKLSLSGMSSGYEVMAHLCRETTGEGSFSDLVIPLIVMTVDLNTRQPVTITEGPLWEALMAATALPGMFPPFQLGEQRLVDGLTLLPVPASAVEAAGADITVSVNLISNEILPSWSGTHTPVRTSVRMLDTLLEAMDLAQMDASIRSAAQADVVITPRFGPATWRDFHVADLFMAAGREAAEGQLAILGTRAHPQKSAS